MIVGGAGLMVAHDFLPETTFPDGLASAIALRLMIGGGILLRAGRLATER